jgi:amino-acid N-acetyltransferase
VFILTTQAIDWFEKLGFVLDNVDSLPEERKQKWNAQRNSKVYRMK